MSFDFDYIGAAALIQGGAFELIRYTKFPKEKES